MADKDIEAIRRRLADGKNADASEIDLAFARLEENFLALVQTIRSAHSECLEELRREAARRASGGGDGGDG